MTAPARSCGTCSLCCKLVPVKTLKKAANTWCPHAQPGTNCGCSIYDARPQECRAWSCLWLEADGLALSLRRPDAARYVCDPAADLITLTQDGIQRRLPVMQVWVDPNYPEAWRDKALGAMMLHISRKNVATLIRHGNTRGTVVFAPPMTRTGKWVFIEQQLNLPETTPEELREYTKNWESKS